MPEGATTNHSTCIATQCYIHHLHGQIAYLWWYIHPPEDVVAAAARVHGFLRSDFWSRILGRKWVSQRVVYTTTVSLFAHVCSTYYSCYEQAWVPTHECVLFCAQIPGHEYVPLRSATYITYMGR
jgi:hypothetical protein